MDPAFGEAAVAAQRRGGGVPGKPSPESPSWAQGWPHDVLPRDLNCILPDPTVRWER